MSKDTNTKINRLNRIAGQVRGVAQMIENDRYCVDVLNQTAAIRAALKGVEKLVIADHTDHCIEHAIRSGDETDQRQKFKELVDIIGRTSQ